MREFYAFLLLIFLSSHLSAQVTTSRMAGIVVDPSGEPLIGATVRAVHVPSGSSYGVITQDNGGYNIPNMRVGGPYRVEVSFLGYASQIEEGIFLTLGRRYDLDFTMKTEGIVAEEVVIIGMSDPILNSERTGPATSVSGEQIAKLPTISRSASDYTRLNTMSAGDGSFAGRNDQFNNYSLDGSIFNNPFGLDASTPGGQANAQPVSLDAIDQISVSVAPYDVTQSGFTGASINSVSKSGTNEFTGTVFGFFRNKAMTGGKVDGEKIFKGDPKQAQYGFSVGGPIVKDKVFFFANFEKEDRSDLGSLWVPSGSSTEGGVSRVTLADMQLVSNLLRDNYGYETGAIDGYTHDEDNYKGLFKLDFNLSDKHKLMASYNFLNAFNDNPAHPSALGRRGPDFQTLQFENSGYRINNRIHQFRAELSSLLSDKISNKFTAGYTQFRDFREAKSAPFPALNFSKDGVRYIVAGHEPFSVNNVLDQDVFQIRNDLSIYSGKHSWTAGVAFERFNFNNSFNLTAYGFRVFDSPGPDISQAEAVITSPEFAGEVENARNVFNNNNANDSWALAETNLGQFSAYVQDEIAVNDKLNISLGLRLDFPLYFNTPDLIQENITRKGGELFVDENGVYAPNVTYFDEDGNETKYNSLELPSNTPLINPRLGFNYDINGDRSAQLRGGTGLFSGRFPMVWVGNQVANPDFFFYNITDPDFKFPQIWRTSLGYDRSFGDGWVATADLLYTKDLQAQVVNNGGLKTPGGTLSGVDSRPIYRAEDRAQGPFGGATNAYVFTNVSGGYSFNASFSIERNWQNTYLKLGYNYLRATDVMSIDAEISSDAYDRNPANIQNTNKALTSPSLYGNRHRIVGVASKKWEWSNPNFATTVSLFFEYSEGGRYSYTYSGDINNDGSGLNDLIYIPTESELSQMNFNSDAEAAAFNAFIKQDDYLSARRGQYAEKYGALSPWYNTWDLRILQDVGIPSSDNKFQISLDVLNVGNMLNSSWGVRQQATNTSLLQAVGVTTDEATRTIPTYSFDSNLTSTFQNNLSVISRWRMQVGLRYIF